MDKDSLVDCSGKYTPMNLVNSDLNYDLYNPSFNYQGGDLFIVGTFSEGASV